MANHPPTVIPARLRDTDYRYILTRAWVPEGKHGGWYRYTASIHRDRTGATRGYTAMTAFEAVSGLRKLCEKTDAAIKANSETGE